MRHPCARRAALFTAAGALLTGCATSPSMLAPQGPQAARVAWLTWLMFGIAAAVRDRYVRSPNRLLT